MDLIKQLDGQLKKDVLIYAAQVINKSSSKQYEHRVRLGTKGNYQILMIAIFHLEAFVVKVASLYAKYLIEIGM